MSRTAAVILALIIGVVLGGLLVYYYMAGPPTGGPPTYEKQLETTIRLSRDSSGRCQIDDPSRIVAAHNDRLTWHVDNQCGEGYTVELNDFKRKLSGGQHGPPTKVTDPPAPRTANEVPAGGRDDIRATAKREDDHSPGNPPRRYKYRIELIDRSGVRRASRDPDYELWP